MTSVTDVIVLGRQHCLVKSRTGPGYHAVDLEPLEGWPHGGCTCKGFSVRKTCFHYQLVVRWMERGL